jgi:hypothetical protein
MTIPTPRNSNYGDQILGARTQEVLLLPDNDSDNMLQILLSPSAQFGFRQTAASYYAVAGLQRVVPYSLAKFDDTLRDTVHFFSYFLEIGKINQPVKNDMGQRLICQTIRWKITEWTFPHLSTILH